MERKSSRSSDSGKVLSSTEGEREVQLEKLLTHPGKSVSGFVSLAQVENQGPLAPDVRARELQGAGLYERVASIKITDAESYTLVCDLGKEAKRIADLIEEEFGPAVAQADKAHKMMVKLRDKTLDKFEEVIELAKAKILETEIEGDVEGVSYPERWYPEIVDIALIPREYLTPDMPKIKALILALKNEARIPGVRAAVKKAVTFRI